MNALSVEAIVRRVAACWVREAAAVRASYGTEVGAVTLTPARV
jgi:glycyl-tRNA synthetase alpha subunit